MTENCGFERSVFRNGQYFSLILGTSRLHIYLHKIDKHSLLFLRKWYVSNLLIQLVSFFLWESFWCPVGVWYCYENVVLMAWCGRTTDVLSNAV